MAGKLSVRLDVQAASDGELLDRLVARSDGLIVSSNIDTQLPCYARWLVHAKREVSNVTAFGDSGPLCGKPSSEAQVQGPLALRRCPSNFHCGIPSGPVTPVDYCPHEANLDHRGMIRTLRDPVSGRDVFVPASPLRMTAHRGHRRRIRIAGLRTITHDPDGIGRRVDGSRSARSIPPFVTLDVGR